MAVELSAGSINDLCNGVNARQPIILQLLGYEVLQMGTDNRYYYRLVLSDGVHMNSYFFLDHRLNDLINQGQLNYGMIIKIEDFRFVDGDSYTDHSPRWTIFIERLTILVHRQAFGYPQPLINIEQMKKPLVNLNLNGYPSRVFYSTEQLERSLIKIEDVKKLLSGKCTSMLKLTLIRKRPVLSFSSCRILNMTMGDGVNIIHVSAFNSICDRMDQILEENKTYYITDVVWKQKPSACELKLQSYSVVIECLYDTPNDESTESINFDILLQKDPNSFYDLIGVCIEVGDVEMCNQPTLQRDIQKREIILIDSTMTTITLKVWGENVNLFNQSFDYPPVVSVKNAVLKQFNGEKYFSLVKFSTITLNPNTDKARELEDWYSNVVSMGDF
ncbi:Replication factor-A protein 1, N-terminal,Nucleic acid-binding, OB-fold,Replication protein [Cinara cedri]|uniref:Replication factor-A protein 1, N-terminal,Nucleic acid-binding, OB-fold,Replication protein n=1 Tax=Cinara cedri TaxID=506608 RepID=A0A5E4MXN0_9HEMI|nr:Replication factor-A protein 1, N-terminal,Nucleic acid-binding, OB-fold,Replication protein [Cinara cedri]